MPNHQTMNCSLPAPLCLLSTPNLLIHAQLNRHTLPIARSNLQQHVTPRACTRTISGGRWITTRAAWPAAATSRRPSTPRRRGSATIGCAGCSARGCRAFAVFQEHFNGVSCFMLLQHDGSYFADAFTVLPCSKRALLLPPHDQRRRALAMLPAAQLQGTSAAGLRAAACRWVCCPRRQAAGSSARARTELTAPR